MAKEIRKIVLKNIQVDNKSSALEGEINRLDIIATKKSKMARLYVVLWSECVL